MPKLNDRHEGTLRGTLRGGGVWRQGDRSANNAVFVGEKSTSGIICVLRSRHGPDG